MFQGLTLSPASVCLCTRIISLLSYFGAERVATLQRRVVIYICIYMGKKLYRFVFGYPGLTPFVNRKRTDHLFGGTPSASPRCSGERVLVSPEVRVRLNRFVSA